MVVGAGQKQHMPVTRVGGATVSMTAVEQCTAVPT